MKPNESDESVVAEFEYDGSALVTETYQGTDRTFVIVHGIGMGRGVFGDLVDELGPHGKIVAVDLPGYGDAPEPPRTPSIERMADTVAKCVEEMALGEVILIGHSMGTQVVTEIAARHPGLANAIVLVAPTVDDEHRKPLVQFSRLMRDISGESIKVMFLGAREYLRAGPNLGMKMKAMLVHRPEDSYGKVNIPALVLRGEDDIVCPRGWCMRVADMLPQGEYQEVPERRHETLIKDAGEAKDRILAFVKRIGV